MSRDFVFSWAENVEGRMVHIDSVPRGLSCGCVCPYCHEKLLARHGDIREHGFAHHSDNRGANLEICYMVSLYKLAEQIIQTNKRIHVPSYYGIYEETDIKFIDVKVDSRFEREDKQPDIIAVTNDQKQYLIEFIFKQYKVQHKQAIDYKNLSCLEIDISNQTFDSLEDFLLSSKDDRRWINNDIYFNCIENKYKKEGKTVKVVSENDCSQCKLKHSCCAVQHVGYIPFPIENNGQKYRICGEIEQYDKAIEALHQREYSQEEQCCKQNPDKIETSLSETESSVSERSCFNCKNNLTWANRGDGWAHCGRCITLRLPNKGKVPPDYAKKCSGFNQIRP